MDEKTFGPLLDLLPDALLVVDTAGVLRDANAATITRFGWNLEEWQGRSLLELIHEDDLNWALTSLGTVVEKEHGSPIELRVKAADGWRLVELIGTPFERSNEQLIVLAIRDLTERRKWEVGDEDTELFRTLMHYSASLTLLTDPTGVVKSASGGLIRTTGLWLEDVLDHPLADTVAPADRVTLDRALSSIRSGADRTATIEVGLRTPEGRSVPCQLTIIDLADDPTVNLLIAVGDRRSAQGSRAQRRPGGPVRWRRVRGDRPGTQ